MYPKTSPAVLLTAYGTPTEVSELEVPALEPEAALVEVEAATMCGTDVHIHAGALAFQSRLPVLMGHEVVGRIFALGSGRTHDALGNPLSEGDRVVWSYARCGSCYWCVIARQPTLCQASRLYGWGSASDHPYLMGGFSQFAYVLPKCQMLKVTEDLEAPVVASATCAFRTVVHGYERLGAVEPHETIVIQGSGPVGLYALAYAVAQGAGQVICIGAPEARLELAARWGASLTLNVETTSSEERLETVMANTDGRGADIVIECSGANVALPEGLALARRGGRYLVVGQADPRPVSVRGTDFNIRQLTVVGVLGGDIPHYFKAIRFLSENQSRFHFADLLGSRYSFDKVNEALGALAEGRELKPIIVNRPA